MSLAEFDDVVIQATFWSCLLLCAVYFVEPWWRSQIGVNLMGKTFFIAAIVLPGVLHITFGTSLTASWIKLYEAVTFSTIPLWVLQRVYLILDARRRDRLHKKRGVRISQLRETENTESKPE